MQTASTIDEIRLNLEDVRHRGAKVGLVPTMGYLHAGHASLMARARAECDVVAATIFVNPLQFGAGEDLDAYPRDLLADTATAEANGVDLLFTPSDDEMYGEPVLTTITVTGLASGFEGASRPTHFAGVATVVAKLCNIFGPCRAYFGEKDWQQLAVVTRMVRDLSFPVEVVGCPTVREADGLALSSRNAYLSDAERAAAPVLRRGLLEGAAAVQQGEREPSAVRAVMTSRIIAEPLANLDYVDVVDAATLARHESLEGELRLLAAVRFGRTRLIDNVGATAD